MVIDKIENHTLYLGINKKVARGFTFLHETDLSQLSEGKYVIDGEEIFAGIQEYNTKTKGDANIESHHQYIDIQYIISGEEYIGVATKENQIPTIRNEKDDYDFYDCDTTLFKMKEGMFAIFFPDDIHMPGVQIDASSPVKKVVIKIKIDN